MSVKRTFPCLAGTHLLQHGGGGGDRAFTQENQRAEEDPTFARTREQSLGQCGRHPAVSMYTYFCSTGLQRFGPGCSSEEEWPCGLGSERRAAAAERCDQSGLLGLLAEGARGRVLGSLPAPAAGCLLGVSRGPRPPRSSRPAPLGTAPRTSGSPSCPVLPSRFPELSSHVITRPTCLSRVAVYCTDTVRVPGKDLCIS